jgi:hypothetical protein
LLGACDSSDGPMAIGKLIRENAALAVGILLPVVVVFFFLLATYVPRWLVDPPQYDFLFTQQGQWSNDLPRWRHVVEADADGQLQVRAIPTKENDYSWRPRLFRYEHATGEAIEIRLPVPSNLNVGENGVAVEMPKFGNSFIDSRKTAPDGYSVMDRSGRQGGLMGLFYRGGRDDLAISKNGAVVAVDAGSDRDRYYYNPQFLGWIIPPSEQ